MKMFNVTTLLIAVLVMALSSSVFANDDKYVVAMQKNIAAIYNAQSVEELQQAVNSFERISAAENARWEPRYYAGYGYIVMAAREKEASKKDLYLDQAMTNIEKGKALKPEDSELTALEGFLYMIRVTVDPASRGAQFSGLAMHSFEKAVSLNSQNPRALMLKAQMQYGTSKFFGSSTAEACHTLASALEKFNTFKAESTLAPQWGKKMAEELKSECQ